MCAQWSFDLKKQHQADGSAVQRLHNNLSPRLGILVFFLERERKRTNGYLDESLATSYSFLDRLSACLSFVSVRTTLGRHLSPNILLLFTFFSIQFYSILLFFLKGKRLLRVWIHIRNGCISVFFWGELSVVTVFRCVCV